jgi:hypothetical protein
MSATIRFVISASSRPPMSGGRLGSSVPPMLTCGLWMLRVVRCSLMLQMLGGRHFLLVGQRVQLPNSP